MNSEQIPYYIESLKDLTKIDQPGQSEYTVMSFLRLLQYRNSTDDQAQNEVFWININKLTNKVWKWFLLNDGSMTKIMKILLAENYKFKLINYGRVEEEYKDQIICLIQNNCSFFQQNDGLDGNIIKRQIKFFNGESLIMNAISYWDEDIYSKIYSNEEEQDKPLGSILIEKKVEYYKITENFLLQFKDYSEVIVFRVSKYTIFRKEAFILFEIFHPSCLETELGSFI
jgi:hypothetical protein